MLRRHRTVHGAQFGASLFESGSRRQPSEQFRHAVNAAFHHRRGEMVRTGHHIGDDFGVRGIGDRGFEHADDSATSRTHGTAAEPYGFAEDARVTMKGGGPETIGQNDDSGS